MVPNPVSDLWGIFKMRVSVGGRCIEGGTASLNQNASRYVRSVRPPERSHRDMIATDFVQHDHLEWRCRCTLFIEAAHVESIRARTAVYDRVQSALVTMECEDHRLIGREKIEELRFAHPVRMHFGRK